VKTKTSHVGEAGNKIHHEWEILKMGKTKGLKNLLIWGCRRRWWPPVRQDTCLFGALGLQPQTTSWEEPHNPFSLF